MVEARRQRSKPDTRPLRQPAADRETGTTGLQSGRGLRAVAPSEHLRRPRAAGRGAVGHPRRPERAPAGARWIVTATGDGCSRWPRRVDLGEQPAIAVALQLRDRPSPALAGAGPTAELDGARSTDADAWPEQDRRSAFWFTVECKCRRHRTPERAAYLLRYRYAWRTRWAVGCGPPRCRSRTTTTR
jgi:hypothetical protein